MIIQDYKYIMNMRAYESNYQIEIFSFSQYFDIKKSSKSKYEKYYPMIYFFFIFLYMGKNIYEEYKSIFYLLIFLYR